HHTISEFLAVSYAGNGALTSTELRFPDLQHVRLTRRDPADGKLRETNIDLAAILEAKERARDLPVEWGDVIEIPELDHREAENWGGFSGPDIANGESLLTRRVKVVVKGEPPSFTIKPPRLASAHPGPMGMVFGGGSVAVPPPRAVPASPSPPPQPVAPGQPGGVLGAPVRSVPAPL